MCIRDSSYIENFEDELNEFDQLAGIEQIAVDELGDPGEALVRARVASGLTQAQLAERVGLQTSAIDQGSAGFQVVTKTFSKPFPQRFLRASVAYMNPRPETESRHGLIIRA